MKDIIVIKADNLAHKIYKITKKFPKEELYGITSQLRRAVLSIVLNLIEGYARIGRKEYIHFIVISYGSLKEVKYLLHFSYKERYLSLSRYQDLIKDAEDIGKLIWNKLQRLKHET